MNKYWEKTLILGWALLCWPSQFLLLLLHHDLSDVISYAFDHYYVDFFQHILLFLVITTPWLMLFLLICRAWIRKPSPVLFFGMILISWGFLGIGWKILLFIPVYFITLVLLGLFGLSEQLGLILACLIVLSVPFILLLFILQRNWKQGQERKEPLA